MRESIARLLLTALTLLAGGLAAVAQELQEDTLAARLSGATDSIAVTASPAATDSIAAPTLSAVVDSIAIPTFSAEQRLKAKVDSLRSLLDENSPERRRRQAGRMLRAADSLRLEYDFQAAVDLCQMASSSNPDPELIPSIEEALSEARNGLRMTAYCTHPKVVAKEKFALEEFFLVYPLKNGSWRPSPGRLDPAPDSINQASYVPDKASALYFTAKDEDGVRNIYHSTLSDGLWSSPALAGEKLVFGCDAAYPMVSQDGRTLYFAAKGLYGMGGYDLYSSRWNRETLEWEEPVNMGFPYSSPYDDFLFANSDDGRFSVFASNRECSADSVYVYVLEYDAMPARKAVRDVKGLKSLAALELSSAEDPQVEEADGAGVGLYMEKMAEVRALRDTIYKYNRAIDGLRTDLADIPPEEQSGRLTTILAMESGLAEMQSELELAVKELQAIELDFLASGVVGGGTQDRQEDEETVNPLYEFFRQSPGEAFEPEFSPAEQASGYAFTVLPEGRFAVNRELPSGLVYQIQFAKGQEKLGVGDLNGLSPVYEKLESSLRYTYTVGVFRLYRDALARLNRVKNAGFRDASIVAFLDGAPVKIERAKEMEKAIR